MNERDRRRIRRAAYHEAEHVLAAHLLGLPAAPASIVPDGRAGTAGHTHREAAAGPAAGGGSNSPPTVVVNVNVAGSVIGPARTARDFAMIIRDELYHIGIANVTAAIP